MSYVFQGDPRLYLGKDGATMKFIGGQPVMDEGLVNTVLISLFTKKGWIGNELANNSDEVIGSEFEELINQSINIQSIIEIEDAVISALDNSLFGDVSVDVSNPEGNRIDVKIKISPPGKSIQEILLSKNGMNWILQSKMDGDSLNG